MNHARQYAAELCDGLNRFVAHQDLSMEVQVQQKNGRTRIVLSPTEPDPFDAKEPYQYEVEDCGETLSFEFDGRRLMIEGSVEDWSVFDYRLHTGEALGCILDSEAEAAEKTNNDEGPQEATGE